MPSLRQRPDADLRRPRHVAAVRELPEADELDRGEMFYPLHVRICSSCLLVQLPAYLTGEDIFSHYAYFSSYSDSWVAHAKRYVQTAVDRLGLAEDSFVVEVASNDGYLLQHVRDLGIRCLGIEPAANIAEVARAKGIDTVCEFLGAGDGHRGGRRARQGRPGRRPTTSSRTCRTSSTSPAACARC